MRKYFHKKSEGVHGQRINRNRLSVISISKGLSYYFVGLGHEVFFEIEIGIVLLGNVKEFGIDGAGTYSGNGYAVTS